MPTINRSTPKNPGCRGGMHLLDGQRLVFRIPDRVFQVEFLLFSRFELEIPFDDARFRIKLAAGDVVGFDLDLFQRRNRNLVKDRNPDALCFVVLDAEKPAAGLLLFASEELLSGELLLHFPIDGDALILSEGNVQGV